MILVFKYIKRYHREDDQELFSIAIETRTRNNGNKLHLPTFHLNIRNSLIVRSKHQEDSLPMETVGSLAMEVFVS